MVAEYDLADRCLPQQLAWIDAQWSSKGREKQP
jgi:hypothetical protein